MNSGELTVDVPLATGESDNEDSLDSNHRSPVPGVPLQPHDKHLKAQHHPPHHHNLSAASGVLKTPLKKPTMKFHVEAAGGDSVTGSLEDLVNSFDEKLSQCFRNYQEQADKIAPVQVRSQEEIMNECQVWWTITGNFGNMMPIDWSKSTSRAKQLPTLNLRAARASQLANKKYDDAMENLEDEDDLVAADLDMHSLILSSNPQENEDPVKSADEVIKEIDDLIDEDEESEDECALALQEGGVPGSLGDKSRSLHLPSLPHSSHIVNQALKGRKLDELSSNELSQILTDIELLVRELSEELVADLGIRDELEYEKELKNTFISLLLSIQSRRRQFMATSMSTSTSAKEASAKSSGGRTGSMSTSAGPYKYLTTVIPYQPEKGSPSLQALQVLVKILKAINEDSPAVPALLTDYILKVLCPSS